tara:strand:- start:3647 stop:4210 length:564 start_codon:yes stop_codon:yes gene_type:complete
MKKVLIMASLLIAFVACEKDEEDNPTTTPTTQNNNGGNNGGGNNGGVNVTLSNSYVFSDDQIVCFPLDSTNMSINSNAILSLVSRPCQNNSSKLDGYFKWQTRPTPGTYQVVGTVGQLTSGFALDTNEYSMVFYNHGPATLYAVSGTIQISKNASDSTKLDMNWTNVDMAYGNDSSIIQFSGNLKGL